MRLIRQKHGVVMMETLLTLPIYIVMLAGLFWLGEVCLTRLVLVEGENFTLWAKGNRHESDNVAAPYMFWFLDSSSKPEEQFTTRGGGRANFKDPVSAAYDWGEINSGNIIGYTQRDGWSLAVNDAITRILWEDIIEEPIDTSIRMDASGAQSGNVIMLSRSPNNVDLTKRALDASYNDSNDWNGIAYGGWNGIFSMSSDGAHAISAYTRNDNYVDWSD